MTGRQIGPVPLPSSTSLRMVLVAVALVVSGLFIGTGLFNALDDSWTATVLGCVTTDPSNIEAQVSCQAPAERERAAAAVGAAVALVVLAIVVVLVMPSVLGRSRRLVTADARYTSALQSVATLADADGMRRPGVLIGPPKTTSEPFCLGRPGDYRIALPRKLALMGNPELFQALIRHELAHISQRDVALSWLARALVYVLAPLLLLPVVVTTVYDGDLPLALDILWRSAVLILVVLLVVRALLRAREFDADLRAAQSPNARHVLDVELSRRPAMPGRWRALRAWHPTAADRRAVLADPATAAALTWVDGLTLGFLAALALPIVTGIAAAALLDAGISGLPALIGALVVGPVFGAAIGIGLWRQALAARPAGRRGGALPVTLGVLLGAALGALASLAGVGVVPDPPIAVPLALASATTMMGGLAEAAVVGPRAASRLPTAVVGAVAAVALVWTAQEAQLVVASNGWMLLSMWMTTAGTLVVPLIAAVVLAAAAAAAIRLRRDAVLVGLGAGIGGGLAVVSYRLVAGPATDANDQLERFYAIVLGAGLVGALAVAVLGLSRGIAGIGAGLLAGPVATVTTGGSYLVLNAALGGNPLPVAWPLLGAAVPTGLLLSAPAALLGLLPVPGVRSARLVAALAAAVCALAATVVMTQRSVLVTAAENPVAAASASGGTNEQGAQALPIPREQYLTVVARDLLERRVAESAALDQFKADHPVGPAAAEQIRSRILPLAEGLVRATSSYRFDDPAVQAVHQHAVTAAAAHVAGLTLLAEAFDRNDRSILQRGNRLLAEGNAEWAAWATAAQAL